ncbi:MAG: hypothetical protein Q9218_004616 [Villophora microphyllina]
MPSNPVSDWIARIPRNTEAAVQRLTLLGWARLIGVVVVYYFVIRPLLLKYTERAQTRNFERIDDEHASRVTPNTLRAAEGASTGAESSGAGARRRHNQRDAKGDEDFYKKYNVATRAEIRKLEAEGEGLDDEDMDTEFLKSFFMPIKSPPNAAGPILYF